MINKAPGKKMGRILQETSGLQKIFWEAFSRGTIENISIAVTLVVKSTPLETLFYKRIYSYSVLEAT